MPRKNTRPVRDNSPKKTARQGAPTRRSQPVKGRKPADREKPAQESRAAQASFAGILWPLITRPTGPRNQAPLPSSPLAHLDYPTELAIKNQALSLFWEQHRLPGKPEPIIESPRPRHYRTTTKRKTVVRGNTLFLLFNDHATLAQHAPFVRSPLEPEEHSLIYEFLQKKISEPAYRLVASHLNYLIIRGSYAEQAVIFNVDTMNGPLVRKLKLLSDHLQKLSTTVTSVSIYPDPSCSEYYLEERQSSDILQFKKLFGRGELVVSHHGIRYFYNPTSFSQVNESMVEIMLDMAHELLAPDPAETLLDLYCGYGLFSHFLAPAYKEVTGIDAEGPSIRAATANKKGNPRSRNARFLAQRITAASVEKIPMPADGSQEILLLDPPRQGPQDGVISALGRREPKKVLHIHCGVDQIPVSIGKWKKQGYRVRRVVPLDMFPGTAGLEVLILLARERTG